MIHPDETESDLTEDEKKSGKYMKRLNMHNDERESLYFSAVIVTLMQFTTIYLVMVVFTDSSALNIVRTDRYEIMVPRLTSSIMMHLICEPDIRNGIELMKYAMNHPYKFRVIRSPGSSADLGNRGLNRRVFSVFLLGLCQTSIGIIAESLIILFLGSRTKLLDVILKFGTMSIIVKFDNMYAAAALSAHDIKAAKGKLLKVTYKRHM